MTRLFRRAAGALLGLILALVLAAAPAYGDRSDQKAMWGPPTRNGHSLFPVYKKLGVGIVQLHLYWFQVAKTRPRHPRDPRDPAYQWPAEIGAAVNMAKHYHMRIMLQVLGTPGWANGNRPFQWVPRHNFDLASFFTAAAKKYKSVHLWMVWGEPSRALVFQPLTPVSPFATSLTPAQKQAPHRYAQLLDAAYAALKGVSKRNLVIGGNTYTTGDISSSQWIENMRLPDGKPPRMDLYGQNPFSFRAPNLANPPSPDREVDFSDLGRFSQLVNRNLAPRHHKIRLFLSEFTIPTAPDNEFNIYTSLAVQAQWITDAWRIVRHSSFIYALGWVHLYDDPPGSHGSMGGLLTYQGHPKPGYYAFKAG